jgi:hypothetical protein
MKKEIVAYVARCDNYCRVKAIHMKPGLLQPLSIPGWKWEEIVMNFFVGLPTMEKGFDSICVIVDRPNKSIWQSYVFIFFAWLGLVTIFIIYL